MKILYLSCHGILEFDEVKILTDLGHEVFCLGDHGGNERPLIPGRSSCSWLSNVEIEAMRASGQGNIPKFAVDRCDAIISMHISDWLRGQWDGIKSKRCFLRLIGQHCNGLGTHIKAMTDEGLKVIPYWANDLKFNGLEEKQCAEPVHFYKDENEFACWGDIRHDLVLTVCNEIMRGDGKPCHVDFYKQATDGLPRLLVGKKNRFFGDFTARVPYDILKEFYRTCAVYLYLGTEPATYTLNLIEAMMTGMPIVAYDNGRGIKDIIPTASSDPDECRDMLEMILGDRSKAAPFVLRSDAIRLFGKQQVLDGWKKVLA